MSVEKGLLNIDLCHKFVVYVQKSLLLNDYSLLFKKNEMFEIGENDH